MQPISESTRVAARDALGFAALFEQADPRLENALTSIMSQANGGDRPDDSSQIALMDILADIKKIYCMLQATWSQLAVMQAGKVRLDAARAAIMLRSEGRRLVTRLSALLSTNPRRDIFSASAPNLDGDAFGDAPGGAMLRRG